MKSSNLLKSISLSLATISALAMSGCSDSSDSKSTTQKESSEAPKTQDEAIKEREAVLSALANKNIGFLQDSSSLNSKATQSSTDEIIASLSNQAFGFSQELYNQLASDSDLVAQIDSMQNKAKFAEKLLSVVEKTSNEATPEQFFEYLEIVADFAPAGVSDVLASYSTAGTVLLQEIKALKNNTKFYDLPLKSDTLLIKFKNQEGKILEEVSDVKLYFSYSGESVMQNSPKMASITSDGALFDFGIEHIGLKVMLSYNYNNKIAKSAYILDESDESITITLVDTPPYIDADCFLYDAEHGEINCANRSSDNGVALSDSSQGYRYQWDFGDNTSSDAFEPLGKVYEKHGEYKVSLKITDTLDQSVEKLVGQIDYTQSENTAPTAVIAEDSINTEGVRVGDVIVLNALQSSDKEGEIVSYSWDLDNSNNQTIEVLTGCDDTSECRVTLPEGKSTIHLVVSDNEGATSRDSIVYETKAVVLSTGSLTHNGFTYGTVQSPYTNKIWLDRNLGASQVCQSYDDSSCYGNLYQWGRDADGHEKRNSSNFNTGNSDWNDSDSDGSERSAFWSKTDGSGICPMGYRVPTIDELAEETLLNGVDDRVDASNNFLKLPSAGYRGSNDGSLNNEGSRGYVWAATPSSSYAHYLYFGSAYAYTYNSSRAYGCSVRCLKD